MSIYTSSTTKPIYHGTQIVWYITGLLEVLLLFRFALKLFGANPSAGFSQFIYNLSYPFVAPFLNVFRITYVQGSVFEWTTLLAMFVYYLVALGIIRLFLMGRSVSTPEAAVRLEEENI
jgi:uncharacterized protein YggT (Ycf19 family)